MTGFWRYNQASCFVWRFCRLLDGATFFCLLDLSPLEQFILVVTTLRLDFVDADVTVGLCGCQYYGRNFCHRNLLWHFIVFAVFVKCLVATFVGWLLYCCYLCCRCYGQTSILSSFIVTCVCWCYDQNSLLVPKLRSYFVTIVTLLPRLRSDLDTYVVTCLGDNLGGLLWWNDIFKISSCCHIFATITMPLHCLLQ